MTAKELICMFRYSLGEDDNDVNNFMHDIFSYINKNVYRRYKRSTIDYDTVINTINILYDSGVISNKLVYIDDMATFSKICKNCGYDSLNFSDRLLFINDKIYDLKNANFINGDIIDLSNIDSGSIKNNLEQVIIKARSSANHLNGSINYYKENIKKYLSKYYTEDQLKQMFKNFKKVEYNYACYFFDFIDDTGIMDIHKLASLLKLTNKNGDDYYYKNSSSAYGQSFMYKYLFKSSRKVADIAEQNGYVKAAFQYKNNPDIVYIIYGNKTVLTTLNRLGQD